MNDAARDRRRNGDTAEAMVRRIAYELVRSGLLSSRSDPEEIWDWTAGDLLDAANQIRMRGEA